MRQNKTSGIVASFLTLLLLFLAGAGEACAVSCGLGESSICHAGSLAPGSDKAGPMPMQMDASGHCASMAAAATNLDLSAAAPAGTSMQAPCRHHGCSELPGMLREQSAGSLNNQQHLLKADLTPLPPPAQATRPGAATGDPPLPALQPLARHPLLRI